MTPRQRLHLEHLIRVCDMRARFAPEGQRKLWDEMRRELVALLTGGEVQHDQPQHH